MQASQTPTLIPLPFAASGTKNTIPEASQIDIMPGAASLTDGFPPLTFTPIAAGGVPPAGADFNGIFYLISQSTRWSHGGGRYGFSSSFASDANVGGYPQGAELLSADLQGTWLSLNDSNTDNPDTGAGTKWVPGRAYGATSVGGLTNANVTLTPAQAAKNKITLSGTLTGNVQIIFPAWIREWSVVNNTTGAFIVTAKTASGTGIALASGQQKITCDGTNILQAAESIAPATLGTQPAQFSQLVANIGDRRNLVCDIPTASASATFTAESVVVGTAVGGLLSLVTNLNATINIGTVGAGGMDVSGLPATASVAVYVIRNPTTGAVTLLGWNASSAAAPNVYGGSAMPSGYTQSALLMVLLVQSSQFLVGNVFDRHITLLQINQLNTGSTTGIVSLTLGAPLNAKKVDLTTSFSSTTTTNANVAISESSSLLGVRSFPVTSGQSGSMPLQGLVLRTPQTIWYSISNSAGTSQTIIALVGYEI